MIRLLPSQFDEAASVIIGRPYRNTGEWYRRFRSHFGVDSTVVAAVWCRLSLPRKAQAKHLLYALFFLKTYQTENNASSHCCIDEQTYRTWVWIIVPRIARLSIVSLFKAFFLFLSDDLD